MYSVQNQFFQQISQLTCGVVATVTNTRVRSSTPRTAHKLNSKFGSRSENHSKAPAASISHQQQHKTVDEALSNNESEVNPSSAAPVWASQAKNALGPLLASHLSKLGPSSVNSNGHHHCPVPKSKESEFQAAVSEFAEKIIDNAAANVKEQNVNPDLINHLWNEVLEAVNLPPNKVGTGWSQKYLQVQKQNLVRNVQASNFYDNERLAMLDLDGTGSNYSLLSSSMRLVNYKSNGSFAVDKRFSPFLHPYSRVGMVPVRTFKTKRDVQAANERNPSLMSRVKDKFFPASKGAEGAAASGTTPASSDKLKAIIADLPPNDADKMKIAFAEGYMSGNTGGTGAGGEKSRSYRWLRTLQQILAIAVFTAILASLMGSGSLGGGMFRVSVGNGNEVQPEDITVTFADVKGVDEAKSELQDIVEFLRNPSKFVSLGGKLPKGVLLVGPPGTGKTLLARAVAGEAGVPFFHAAGPEFDEILVGQGARRVRDLFKAAKLKAPCVIFIDEIDSVGAKRTNSVLHPYANQTINQLLSEMDGFRQNEGVIVLGATNRREDLDRALLRPGRFDVEVPVPAPEYQGRKDILELYLGRVKTGNDVDVDILARGTTGFTGADLENMVNQAALKAAIDGADFVGKKHLDFARDKVIMGPQRKARIPDEEVNKITAYHEAGHALASYFTKDSNPIHKVTIIPRGSSLGHTAYIPDKEQYHVTKSQLMALMDTMMGGRAAEELIFGAEKVTSGASSDLKQATSIATHMVKEWGMSEKVGLRTIEDNSKSLVAVNDLGPQTSELIDAEINRILRESYERAKAILKTHAKEHKALAEALIKYETLDADDVKAILSGKPPQIPHKKELVSGVHHPAKPTTPPVAGGAGGGLGAPGKKALNPCSCGR